MPVLVEVNRLDRGCRTRRGKPIIANDELLKMWDRYENPILLTAVRARKAGPLIQASLNELGLVEGKDWWAAA